MQTYWARGLRKLKGFKHLINKFPKKSKINILFIHVVFFFLLNVDSFSRLNVTSCRKYDIFQFHSSRMQCHKFIDYFFITMVIIVVNVKERKETHPIAFHGSPCMMYQPFQNPF